MVVTEVVAEDTMETTAVDADTTSMRTEAIAVLDMEATVAGFLTEEVEVANVTSTETRKADMMAGATILTTAADLNVGQEVVQINETTDHAVDSAEVEWEAITTTGTTSTVNKAT
jgi:DUF1009 family protein